MKVQGDSEATQRLRADYLWDFCTGYPARYRKQFAWDHQPTREELAALNAKRIHDGYGDRAAESIIQADVNQWRVAHARWKATGGHRSSAQAMKRMYFCAVKLGKIKLNPMVRYEVPKGRARAVFITPEQEAVLMQHAAPDLALAIQICIRTGARYGKEYCVVEAKHIEDRGDRMTWTLISKSRRQGGGEVEKKRVLRLKCPVIIQRTREAMAKYPTGPIFRRTDGTPWRSKEMGQAFRDLVNKVKATTDTTFDDDICMYATRHTYAKRALAGEYNGGVPINLETLAKLMGNTPKICREHYLNWADEDPGLWGAC